MQKKSAADVKFTRDKTGRSRFSFPRTGPLNIVLRGNKFFRATCYNHYDDLAPILKDGKARGEHSAIIVSDNGPDWNKNAIKTLMLVGRLWRDLNLDYVCLTAYASKDSRFNMIEHAWAPVNSWLVGLCLSECVPGETDPPDKQSQLSESERVKKEKVVLDNAIEDVKRCLQGHKYDGFPVTITGVTSGTEHVYNDEAEVAEIKKAHLTVIKKNPQLQERAKEFQFLQRNAVQRRYTLEFVKCTLPECEHCTEHPVQSVKLMTFLRETGNCVLSPVLGVDPQGNDDAHFLSWRDLAAAVFEGKLQRPGLDEGLPSTGYDGPKSM